MHEREYEILLTVGGERRDTSDVRV